MATYNSSSQASSTTAPYNIARPSGVASGTYMVAVISNDVGNDSSAIGITGGTTWNPLTSGVFGQTAYRLFWKVADASEPTTYSVTFNPNGSAYSTAHIITSNDAGNIAPVWQVLTTAGSATAGPTPGITPIDDATLEIRFILASPDNVARTWSAPPGLTERTDVQQGGYPTGSSATRTLSSSAATTTLNFTASGSVPDRVGITVGVPKLIPPQSVSPSGIASEEAFGTVQVNLSVAVPGITSAEAFGTLVTRLYLSPTGIPSGEAFGTPDLTKLFIAPSGIPSAEQFGLTIAAVEQFISPLGIPSGEALGSISLQLGYPQTVEVEGIGSLEYVSDLLTVTNRQVLVFRPPSIQETPAGQNILHVRYGVHRGISVIKRQDGSIYQTRYPALTDLEVSARHWLGGYRHIITLAEAEELTAAGFGSYIHLETDA